MTSPRDAWRDRVREATNIVELVEQAGVTLRQSGHELVGRCPFHEDRTPSFAVNPEKGVWNCHGCGEGGDVFEFVMRRDGIGFSDALRQLSGRAGIPEPEPGAKRGQPAPRIVATYPYQDESGALLCEVVRRDPKDFRQRRPVADGKWVWNLKGVRRVPYRLPELLAAPADATVFVVEGERDADALRFLGLVGTTNSGGAGKWAPELSEHFRGRDIVILPDNDGPGRAHAQAVARALAGVAATVRVLELPGLPEKGDVSDWLAAHRGDGLTEERIRQELVRLVEAAPVWQPAAERQPAPASVAQKHRGTLELEDPVPASDPVDGSQLFGEIVVTLKRYLVLPPHADMAIVLWVALSHLTEVVEVLPRLLFTSPTRACGKTRALAIVGALVARPLHAASITPAALFRAIDEAGPTLLLDEMDNAQLAENPELRAVLNSGHTRTSASVVRVVGNDLKPKRFSTWAPVAFACIGKLPDTITSRCVRITMRRRAAGQTVARLRESRLLSELEHLRSGLARWALDQAEAIRLADPGLPEALGDREADNWAPLLAIADEIGGAWPDTARKAALALSGAAEGEEDSLGVQLLGDLKIAFGDEDEQATAQILEKLHGMEERPWKTYGRRGEPMTPRDLAQLLRPFGIESRTIRLTFPMNGKSTKKGYDREWLEDAWERYLPASAPTNRHAVTDNEYSGQDSSSDPSQPEPYDGGKSAVPTNEHAVCDEVTGEGSGYGPLEVDVDEDVPQRDGPGKLPVQEVAATTDPLGGGEGRS